MTLNPDPPDASSIPDSGHARWAGRPQDTEVMVSGAPSVPVAGGTWQRPIASLDLGALVPGYVGVCSISLPLAHHFHLVTHQSVVGTLSEFMSISSSCHPPPMDDSCRINDAVAAAKWGCLFPFFLRHLLGVYCKEKPSPLSPVFVSAGAHGFLFYNPFYH